MPFDELLQFKNITTMNILRKQRFVEQSCCPQRACVLCMQKRLSWKYADALNFRMINKGFADTETPFTRLPKYLKDSVRADYGAE